MFGPLTLRLYSTVDCRVVTWPFWKQSPVDTMSVASQTYRKCLLMTDSQ